jgi:hypothetical protein
MYAEAQNPQGKDDMHQVAYFMSQQRDFWMYAVATARVAFGDCCLRAE